MIARGLSYGVGVGAIAATGYVAWQVASSRMLTLLVGAVLGLRVAEIMHAREAAKVEPPPPGADVIEGLRTAYRTGSERWAHRSESAHTP